MPLTNVSVKGRFGVIVCVYAVPQIGGLLVVIATVFVFRVVRSAVTAG